MTAEPMSDLEALAAEYALGSLDASDRRRAQDLLRRNEAFAELVARWETQLAPLADGVRPVEPPADLWRRIEHELGGAGLARPVAGAAAPGGRPLLASLAFWRWTTLGASGLAAAAAALALYFGALGGGSLPADGQRYVAVLNAGQDQPALVITVDTRSGRMTIRPVQTEQPQNTSLQLWLVAGGTPRPLGLLDPLERTSLSLPPAEAGLREASLAVSLEPPGGSPTGLPTGPVLYHGKLLPLDE